VLSVPAIPPSAPPAAEPPAKRRLPVVEVLVVVAVLAVAGIAFALLAGGDDDGSPTAVADPSSAASSSPASSATSSPGDTPSPSPEPSPTEEGPSISVQGVEIRLSSASLKERYVSGDETFVPGVGGDIFLIVRGTFEGDGDRIHDLDITVVDENGRRDGTSFIVTDVILSEGQGQGDVEWVFTVSEASGSFTMSLPGGNEVDVTHLLR
jgi:hypothetical protein